MSHARRRLSWVGVSANQMFDICIFHDDSEYAMRLHLEGLPFCGSDAVKCGEFACHSNSVAYDKPETIVRDSMVSIGTTGANCPNHDRNISSCIVIDSTQTKKNFSMPPTKKQRFSADVSNTTLRAYYMEDITEPEHAIQVASYQPIISRERCLYVCKWLSRAYNYHLFAQPVDWETLGLLNYPDIIKNPMDFSTIVQYVRSDAFIFKVFLDHCRLVWSNAQDYNPEGHPVHIVSKRLSRMFENKIVMMQTHQDDSDSYKIHQQLHSIFFALENEDFAYDFCYGVNVELFPEYARIIDIPYCLSYVRDDLLEAIYHNTYDILDDVNHIVKNAIQFNGENSEIGTNSLRMKGVFERLFFKISVAALRVARRTGCSILAKRSLAVLLRSYLTTLPTRTGLSRGSPKISYRRHGKPCK